MLSSFLSVLLLSFLFFFFFFFNDTATTEIYTLSLHDALPISPDFDDPGVAGNRRLQQPRKPAAFSPRVERRQTVAGPVAGERGELVKAAHGVGAGVAAKAQIRDSVGGCVAGAASPTVPPHSQQAAAGRAGKQLP